MAALKTSCFEDILLEGVVTNLYQKKEGQFINVSFYLICINVYKCVQLMQQLLKTDNQPTSRCKDAKTLETKLPKVTVSSTFDAAAECSAEFA